MTKPIHINTTYYLFFLYLIHSKTPVFYNKFNFTTISYNIILYRIFMFDSHM